MPDCLNGVEGCGVHLAITATGKLTADAVVAALPCNALRCIPNQGLYVEDDEALVLAGTGNPASGWNAGVPLDLFTLPVGLPLLVSFSGTFGVPDTFVNESACRYANVISVVTGREVRVDGPVGAFFRVTTFEKINGIGFFPIITEQVDMRIGSAVISHTDARTQGSRASGRLIPPSGAMTFEYQTYLTNLGTVLPGTFVSSPGFTFCHWSMTN